MTLLDKYSSLVSSGQIREDLSQKAALIKLEKIYNSIIQSKSASRPLFTKILKASLKNTRTKGGYIYGDVGRGKSMLLDLFFENLPIEKKKRVHFHAFMLDVHARLHKWRKDNKFNKTAKDPVAIIARDIAKESEVLCFDELQVNDITDAMILGRLFLALFKNNVVIIATSNRHPKDLYKDGLQRERFLPFIKLIKERLEIIHIEAEIDYRFQHLKSLKSVYQHPLGKKASLFIQQTFASLTNDAQPVSTTLNISGRKLVLSKTHGDIAWTSFSNLCERALGAADYIALAKEYSTILLEGIPKMSRDNRNEAKRFVTLIDELYEHKVKLIATAEVAPEELYNTGDGSFEFKRTVSRLIEMQSEQYLAEIRE